MHYNSDDQDTLAVSAVITALITCLGLIAMTLILFGCQNLPQLAQSIEEIATDDAITIQVDRDAIKKDTDVYINVKVLNKDKQNAPTEVQK